MTYKNTCPRAKKHTSSRAEKLQNLSPKKRAHFAAYAILTIASFWYPSLRSFIFETGIDHLENNFISLVLDAALFLWLLNLVVLATGYFKDVDDRFSAVGNEPTSSRSAPQGGFLDKIIIEVFNFSGAFISVAFGNMLVFAVYCVCHGDVKRLFAFF